MSYEDVSNSDLVAVVKPREMTVVGEFAVRGGTEGTVSARYMKGAR